MRGKKESDLSFRKNEKKNGGTLSHTQTDLPGEDVGRDDEHEGEWGEEPTEYCRNESEGHGVIRNVLILWLPLLGNLCACTSSFGQVST